MQQDECETSDFTNIQTRNHTEHPRLSETTFALPFLPTNVASPASREQHKLDSMNVIHEETVFSPCSSDLLVCAQTHKHAQRMLQWLRRMNKEKGYTLYEAKCRKGISLQGCKYNMVMARKKATQKHVFKQNIFSSTKPMI